MPDPAWPARSARVPTSGRSLAGDAQISTSARELRSDAGSCPFGGGPCKARTPRDYEACREHSPRDPSRDPSIRQPLYVVPMRSPPRAMARIVTGSEPLRARRRRRQRRQVRAPVSAYSQDTRFPPGAPEQTAHAVALASLLPFDVDVDHLLPVLDAQVVEGRNWHKAGIVNENVKLAVPLTCQFYRLDTSSRR